MLWKLLLGGLVGAAGSAAHRAPANVSLALDPPTLSIIMDPTKDIVPIRAVIVGGGYAGSKMAYQLDSMFDVTHIDEKNFYELTNDIIPILTNPWKDDINGEACRRMTVLHRYYLKRSNVVTGTVTGVNAQQVHLRDGRTVPYDILIVATGERKPFPFQTHQQTISGRMQELKRFNEFLQTCRKVAVIGGGPVGTSLAHDLASARPDVDVHLYHQRAELLPRLPGVCRRHAQEKLRTNDNLHLHLATRVTDVDGVVLPKSPDTGAALKPMPSSPPSPTTTTTTSASPVQAATTHAASWWRSGLSLVGLGAGGATLPTTFRVHYDTLENVVRPQQSILQQVYHGKQDEVQACGAVQSHGVEDGFDYVFSLTGDTPRPVHNGDSGAGDGHTAGGLGVLFGRRGASVPNLLREHETKDGHYRVSTLMQLFNHPNIFAVGRCTNLPVLRGYGSSDIEARTLFRELNSVVSNPATVFLHSRDGVQPSRMVIPRLHVRLGVDDAVGCTPWSGGMTGVSAVHEFMQDRNYLLKEFQRPVFYKQQDQAKIKKRVTQWLADEITDIIDFSHC